MGAFLFIIQVMFWLFLWEVVGIIVIAAIPNGNIQSMSFGQRLLVKITNAPLYLFAGVTYIGLTTIKVAWNILGFVGRKK